VFEKLKRRSEISIGFRFNPYHGSASCYLACSESNDNKQCGAAFELASQPDVQPPRAQILEDRLGFESRAAFIDSAQLYDKGNVDSRMPPTFHFRP
jgi:hypothetical protein